MFVVILIILHLYMCISLWCDVRIMPYCAVIEATSGVPGGSLTLANSENSKEVCVHICVCLCVCVHTYVHVCMRLCVHICVCACMHACVTHAVCVNSCIMHMFTSVSNWSHLYVWHNYLTASNLWLLEWVVLFDANWVRPWENGWAARCHLVLIQCNSSAINIIKPNVSTVSCCFSQWFFTYGMVT